MSTIIYCILLLVVSQVALAQLGPCSCGLPSCPGVPPFCTPILPVRPYTCCCSNTHEAFKWTKTNTWFQIFDCPMTWDEANLVCQNRMTVNGNYVQGKLVTIDSQYKQDFVEYALDRHYGGTGFGIWMGLKRNYVDQTPCNANDLFYWVDQTTPFSYTNWMDQQPNCYWTPEDCGHLIDVNGTYKWNDSECSNRFKFMCEAAESTTPFFGGGSNLRFDIGK